MGFDVFYGSFPWLLRAVADARSNATLYLEDPAPYRPRRRGAIGRPSIALRARTGASTMGDFFTGAEAGEWQRLKSSAVQCVAFEDNPISRK